MAIRFGVSMGVLCAAGVGGFVGCASPFDQAGGALHANVRTMPVGVERVPTSVYREDGGPALSDASTPDDYVRYALYQSPRVEAAYQRWRAAGQRLPQVSALPDPRLTIGFFLDEVETRVGAQRARVGVRQTFPWAGKLADREEAAGRAARAAWRRFEGERLRVTERVVATLHDLAYLDAATRITGESLDLLRSFEAVVRAKYRVGVGSHPELVRVQVELGQLEDRLAQLRAMRPATVAALNAELNREAGAGVPEMGALPGRVAAIDAAGLSEIARRSNPSLLALDERVEQQRALAEVARGAGQPDLTVGLDYTITGEAPAGAIAESGDDPIFLSLGINVPLWRGKYDAGVREAIARRLVVSHERGDESNRIEAALHRAWFEHTDADRRVRLYERTLIPKGEESLRASLAGFRAGEGSLLGLLDAERTLLEFAIAGERARSERGKALARIEALVGEPVATRASEEMRP